MIRHFKGHPGEAIVIITLLICIGAIFGQTATFSFVAIDDYTYVKYNYVIEQGLTIRGLGWAFTSFHAANWHPLTWISHMLDIELYGMWPGMHHLTNVFLHALNASLLFILLRYCTGCVWRSASVAFLFAVHPLHVESVAWIAERKDVLSTLFWMLTMLGYAWYVRRPSFSRYLLVAASFTLGLMAKPMLVTLPFVLLLFDFWPLKRDSLIAQGSSKSAVQQIQWPGMVSLLVEKVPLFILAAASSVFTFAAQKAGGAVSTLEAIPIDARISNALISYVAYLWRMIWPFELAVFYPLDRSQHLGVAAYALALILLITLIAGLSWKKRPYFALGWLWYLGTLVPVIGIIQVGAQSMADRYTYIPLIGIFILLIWGVSDLMGRTLAGKTLLVLGMSALVVVLSALSWSQVGVWKDSVTLFTHAVGITQKNYLTHNNLGCALYEKGDMDGAIHHFNEALEVYPTYALAHANLGLACARKGCRDEAVYHYFRAMKLGSSSASSHFTIAKGLSSFGYIEEAVQEYRKALELNPYHAGAWSSLGALLVSKGKYEEGRVCYTQAVSISPSNPEARMNLAKVLANQGNMKESLAQVETALRYDPDNQALLRCLSEIMKRMQVKPERDGLKE